MPVAVDKDDLSQITVDLRSNYVDNTDMDADLFTIIALISGLLAILDKLYVYGKSAYQAIRKGRLWARRGVAWNEKQRLTLTRGNEICNEIPLDIDFRAFLSPLPL